MKQIPADYLTTISNTRRPDLLSQSTPNRQQKTNTAKINKYKKIPIKLLDHHKYNNFTMQPITFGELTLHLNIFTILSILSQSEPQHHQHSETIGSCYHMHIHHESPLVAATSSAYSQS